MSAVVITPTVGTKFLEQAMESVRCQDADHWIVVDGTEHAMKVGEMIKRQLHRQKLIILPENTGRPSRWFFDKPLPGFFNGHRMYAAMPYLVSQDYTLFLDEDNWFEPNHIETMIKTIEDKNLDWCYSLRKVMDPLGGFVCNDDCDSLGEVPTYHDHMLRFVDMNCYCFKTEVLVKCSHVLYDTHVADRMLYAYASQKYIKFATTGEYTVNYRLSHPGQREFFLVGNHLMEKGYKSFPWRKQLTTKE